MSADKPDFTRDGALGESNGEATLRAIVRAIDQTLSHNLSADRLYTHFHIEIDGRRSDL